MFFVASKVFWFLANPGNVILIALCVGTLMLWTPWRRAGRRIAAASVLVFGLLAVFPLGTYVTEGLENRIPQPAHLPDRIDGIVSLGGVIDPFVTNARNQTSLGGAAERLTELAALAKRYPDAKLIFSGGSGNLMDQSEREADMARPLLALLGVGEGRILFENDARNTYENAVLSKRLAAPGAGETWILITSAFHMPRALGCFRAVGWDVIPYPVDYGTTGESDLSPTFSAVSGLGAASAALHEWLGLIFYYLSGRTNELYPALSSRTLGIGFG